MFSEDLIFELVGLIYEAAGDPQLWLRFLERLGSVSRAQVAEFGYIDEQSVSHNLVHVTGIDASDVRFYNTHYSHKNAWIEGAKKRIPWCTGAVAAGHQVCPDRELVRTEHYNDFLRPLDLHYGMAGIVLQEGSQDSFISIVRSKSQGPCSEEEVALLSHLMPHLRRAVELHRRIAGLENTASAAADVLDRLPIGLILVGAKSNIVMLNRRARAIVEQNDGLTVSREGLRAVRADETRQLQGLIHGATITGAGNGTHPGGVMTVSRPSLRRPYGLLVSPLRSSRSWLGAEHPSAAIFVTDPDTETERQDQILGRLFALTPAEARLADALLHGKSLKEAAEEFGVRRNTVHSQLQKIFEKTGTNRQSELLRLILNSPVRLE